MTPTMSQTDDSEAQPDADAIVAPPKMLTFDHSHSQQRFMSSDLSLLETGHFSDIILRCGDKAWNLHKSILCKRSTWFEKALTGNWEEAQTEKITLTDIAPEPVNVVIHYLYSGAIDIAAVDKCEGGSIVCKYVSLWSVANFFLLDTLQKDIISAIQSHFEGNMKPMCNAKWVIDGAHGKAIIQDFFHAVTATYRDFPHAEPCRRVVIDYAHAIRLNLYRSSDFVEKIELFPDLASDLFIVAVKGRQSRWAGDSKADYRTYFLHHRCMDCKCKSKKPASWNVNPQAEGKSIRVSEVPWRCENCVEKSGFPWENRDQVEAEK